MAETTDRSPASPPTRLAGPSSPTRTDCRRYSTNSALLRTGKLHSSYLVSLQPHGITLWNLLQSGCKRCIVPGPRFRTSHFTRVQAPCAQRAMPCDAWRRRGAERNFELQFGVSLFHASRHSVWCPRCCVLCLNPGHVKLRIGTPVEAPCSSLQPRHDE